MTQPRHSDTAKAEDITTLAVDLDGTFLGGPDDARDILYHWVRENSQTVRVIFVTGRDPDFISGLCAAGRVPAPQHVIGDVGTTIARFTDGQVQPLADLEAPIAAAWQGLGPVVRQRLQDIPGLTLQDIRFRHRLSYHYDTGFDPDSLNVVADLAVDTLISHGCFVDILPGGVSKGPSLLRLLAHLGLPAEKVLVAGDTLNDLSMFQTGLRGAVVGGAETDLLTATSRLPNALHCKLPGAAGIIEAIRLHNLHPNPPEYSS